MIRRELYAAEQSNLTSMQKISDQQSIILDQIQKNKKLTEEKERNLEAFKSKVSILEGEKDRAVVTRK